ncbi:MAG: 3-hydroxyacyl-CoA dehydrogenase [Acidobacteria bacterium]|nr:3-hydroxyacyl-CoA dehydrogenase [Acidobacteriota bacterium]MCH8015580.1 3-hydroxyacyl-CoA dehydrogenase [Acidobacteriota bacterium]TDI11251.1 MAG: 3-hydroxyacyl-CoA dehydrogenase [Acidobacteriota bacterium]
MFIKGKSAMVTGGASGLGSATVRRLHSLGAKVLIADLNQKAGKTLEDELGEGALFIETDVTRETSVKKAIEGAVNQHGGVHILVNCAGIAIAEKILGRTGPHDLEHFNRIIEVNLIGTFNTLRLTAAAMEHNQPGEEGERGVIVNTASVAAFEGQIGQAAYAASKGGIVSLTLPAARELSHQGIRVISIAPGIFDTPLLAGLPERARISLGEQIPFPPRLGRPDEYAALVQHIVENVTLNGETIRLDGALRMGPR